MSLPTTPLSNEEKQASLLQTAKQLLAAHTADELWTAVTETARLLLTAERAAIFLYDEELIGATCPFAIGLSDGYIKTICQQVESAPSQQMRQAQQPLIINDILTDPRTAVLRDVMIAEQFTAYAAFPLMTPENDLLGTLIVYRNHAIPFAPGDISAGEMLTHMTAMTLNNLQLLAETRLNLRREQQLNEITQTLASALDLPTILGHVIRMTAGIVGADAGMLGLMIDRQIMTFYPHNIPPDIVLRPAPRGRGVAWEVVQSGETDAY